MQKQPNILLILTDQHRLSALGSYGITQCKTPNIDRLAAEGVRFETAYTSCPLCSPARATIISGQYPHRHGVTGNCGAQPCAVWNIPNHERMLPRRLIEQGYRCGYTGKWHLCPEAGCIEWYNRPIPHHVPSTLGFEGQDFMGHGGGGYQYTEYRQYLADNQLSFSLRPGSSNPQANGWPSFAIQEGGKEATVDHFLANNTISLIDKFHTANQPFFIWHNHWGPHEPYNPVDEFYDLYKDLDIPQWPNYEIPPHLLQFQHDPKIHPLKNQLDWSYWQEAIRHYYAFTTQIDDQIGRLLNHLEETGLLDETIIIFSSDHGETIGSHGHMMDKGYSHFEEIQRIGMLIRYPEKYRPENCLPGTVRSEFTSLVDIYPTCLDLAGVPIEKIDSQGASMNGLLNGKISDWRDSAFVEFFGMTGGTTMITCRHQNWKYGWNMIGQDELYNLDDDPYEMHNLVNDASTFSIRCDLLNRIAEHLPEGLNSEAKNSLKRLKSAKGEYDNE